MVNEYVMEEEEVKREVSGDPLREVSEKMRWQRSRQLLQDTVCLSFKEQR